MQVYGADKVWKQTSCEGIAVARYKVERLMRRLGLRGVRRGKVIRTTVSNVNAPCRLDSGQPTVRSRPAKPALGVGLHVRLHLAGLTIRSVCD